MAAGQGNVEPNTPFLQLVSRMAEGARFEAPETLETIGHELTESSDSPALTDETEEGREPIKTDREG